jgi:osmotically-inducible protein OsmY
MLENHGRTRLLAIQEQRPRAAKETLAVQTDAQSQLRNSGYPELRLVSCEFHEGVLTLRGRVSTFYLKQVAQTLIRELDGVEQVNNRVEVAAQPHSA